MSQKGTLFLWDIFREVVIASQKSQFTSKHPQKGCPYIDSPLDFHGLITRGLVLIKKGDASPFKDFKSCNLKYAKLDKSKVVFKDYNFNQNLLLPPSLEELIDPNHPVRVVNQVVDNLNIDPILAKYKGGGCPAYHPRLMLKVLVYGYLTNQYSSRKIEQALHQNIHFMWLSGMSYPDHNTINRFRSDRLKGCSEGGV